VRDLTCTYKCVKPALDSESEVLKFFIIGPKLLIKHYLFEANEFICRYIRVEQPIIDSLGQ
jgi:hypothetical protein